MSSDQYVLPSITQLATLPITDQTTLLNHLFEPHPTIHQYLSPLLLFSAKTTTHTTYQQFIESCRVRFHELDPYSQLTKDIISSHPRLGLPKASSSTDGEEELSVHSKAEQANLQRSSTPSQLQRFIQLNKDYESKFPGLRFVLFVNGRGKDEIEPLFEQRIQRGDYVLEVKEALDAMCDIALDRVRKLQMDQEESKL